MLRESVSPVAESVPDKTERGRSTIEWPYFSLDDATRLTKGVYELGGACTIDQLAGHLNQAASGGAFRLKVQAARTFDLVKIVQGKLSLTELGHRIMEPESASAARVDAFLTVPLYKALYEAYKGKLLPPAGGLEVAIVNLGVAPKQKEKARQAFQRSARDAGFFAYGSTKLVIPVLPVGPVKPQAEPRTTTEDSLGQQTRNPGGGNGSGGGIPPDLNPFIKGLLDELPPAKTVWSAEGRKNWLIGAASIFNLIYKADSADNYDLSITLDKTSAN